MVNDYLITVMEWIGTVAFAVSGSLIAISCSLDLFGVIIVGCITAVGGGITRDLLIGNTPPLIFSNSEALLLAFITTLVVFWVAHINSKKFSGLRAKIEHMNVFFDAVGLSAFSITGTEIACAADFSGNALLAIAMGVITGIGGGILRDVLVNKKPYVLTKHIYAVASILGSGLYYLIKTYTAYETAGTLIAVSITVLIRLLAAKFRWKLPKVKLEDTEEP